MSYVHLLAAWQSQDLNTVDRLIDPQMEAEFVYPDGSIRMLDRKQVIDIFVERFRKEQDWQFDVIYKTERGNEDLVVVVISRFDDQGAMLENAALTIFTFKHAGQISKLTRIHMEVGVTNHEVI